MHNSSKDLTLMGLSPTKWQVKLDQPSFNINIFIKATL